MESYGPTDYEKHLDEKWNRMDQLTINIKIVFYELVNDLI